MSSPSLSLLMQYPRIGDVLGSASIPEDYKQHLRDHPVFFPAPSFHYVHVWEPWTGFRGWIMISTPVPESICHTLPDTSELMAVDRSLDDVPPLGLATATTAPTAAMDESVPTEPQTATAAVSDMEIESATTRDEEGLFTVEMENVAENQGASAATHNEDVQMSDLNDRNAVELS